MTVHLFDLGGLNLPLAYIGMGPEFVPYFMALLGVIGAALVAVVQWPISALLGWLKGKRNRSKDAETPAASESRALGDVD
jgi:hypothetical protein